MRIKYSVVVPVYNAEKYLDECISSIISDKREDLEVILVDDGSVDDSLKICRSFSAGDSRIHVFHQANQGVSAARNEGLRHCTGEWILFVDSDDSVSPDYLTQLDSALSDVRDSEMLIWLKDKNKDIPDYLSGMDIQDFLLAVFECADADNPFGKCSSLGTVWMKAFRRSLIHGWGLRFHEGLVMGEDLLFVVDCVLKCSKISFVEGYYYNYRENPDSASRAINPSVVKVDPIFQVEAYKTLSESNFPNSELISARSALGGMCLGIRSYYLRLNNLTVYRREVEKFVKTPVYQEAFRKYGKVKAYLWPRERFMLQCIRHQWFLTMYFCYYIYRTTEKIRKKMLCL